MINIAIEEPVNKAYTRSVTNPNKVEVIIDHPAAPETFAGLSVVIPIDYAAGPYIDNAIGVVRRPGPYTFSGKHIKRNLTYTIAVIGR